MNVYEKYLKEGRSKKNNISAKDRKVAVKVIQDVLKPTYFNGIPMNRIVVALRKINIVLVQEDNTEWSGFFTGSEGRTTIRIAPLESGELRNGLYFYEPYDNTMLVLSWYQIRPGRMEVTGYIS